MPSSTYYPASRPCIKPRARMKHWREVTRSACSTGYRWRSKTYRRYRVFPPRSVSCSMPTRSPTTTVSWQRGCGAPAPSSSARPTYPNSGSARTRSTACLEQPTIPMRCTRPRAEAPAAPRPLWLPACCPSPTAAIWVGRSEIRHLFATSWGFDPRWAECPTNAA